jgi:putative endonuclease
MARKDEFGREGEERAARHLAERGWVILDRNWRCADGEIDIVARLGDRVAIVEVKTRTSLNLGHPFEAVDERKLRRLQRLARAWARTHPDLCSGTTTRIDAIGILGPDPRTGRLEHLEGLR